MPKAKARQSKHYKQKAKRTVSLPRPPPPPPPQKKKKKKKNKQTATQNKNTYMQRHAMKEIVNQSRSTALEGSVQILLETLLKLILRDHNPNFVFVYIDLWFSEIRFGILASDLL